ncbi:hypothetical protein BRADI_2g53283v3 [Brachypodium distachyon]|uniref:non-specific serine/threonine protein kinase n=1 Tax=Brachypodium distachyon TaxID=15368 RepID=A0A2K2DFP5_BRADI|nr:hypothetical protein BRADI_2g53283v3 [Brachypodium distachyon]
MKALWKVLLLFMLLASIPDLPASWKASTDPCGTSTQWDGVTCDKGRVTSLDLSFNTGLGGPLPAAIGELSQLTTLILIGCSFTGGIQDLGNLVQLSFFHFNKNQLTGNLTGLFNSSMSLEHILFDNNQLSGPIPPELGGITTLQILRLDKNSFTGQVPTNISNLVNLTGLNLANNKLRGKLPDLTSLTKLKVVDLSNNSFDPSVAPDWFSTLKSLASVCAYPYTASWGVAQKDSGGAPQLKGARFFSFDELKNCTNNFSESHEIGSGGYGKVYKGMIADGTTVAIKRAEYGSKQGAVEFKNEIELMSRVHHRNLVSLIGFCYEQGEQMLVYEYISNGTLRENLQARGIYLDWKKRLRIALGSARGLAYLHELADPPIIHRDVKSTNILLDDSLKAKVADFGLSKLVADTEKGHVSTQGYLDPEYYMTQQLSEKSDVYSFGVVMLELLSARLPITKGRYIVREFRIAIDPNDNDYYGLQSIIDPAIHDAAKSAAFRRFVQLAMECVEESAARRPTMSSVVKEIEMMLQNEGLSSSSSSVTEFEHAGQATADPYSRVVAENGSNSSGGISEEPSHPETQH